MFISQGQSPKTARNLTTGHPRSLSTSNTFYSLLQLKNSSGLYLQLILLIVSVQASPIWLSFYLHVCTPHCLHYKYKGNALRMMTIDAAATLVDFYRFSSVFVSARLLQDTATQIQSADLPILHYNTQIARYCTHSNDLAQKNNWISITNSK